MLLLRRMANEMPLQEELPAEQLSQREREVLRLLTHDQTNREIAQNLIVSVRQSKSTPSTFSPNSVSPIVAKLPSAPSNWAYSKPRLKE